MPYYPIFGKEIFIPLIDQDFYDAYDLTKKIDTIHTTKKRAYYYATTILSKNPRWKDLKDIASRGQALM